MTNEELQQKIEQLEQQITELKSKVLENKAKLKSIPYSPYEVEVPTDIEDYYSVDMFGEVDYLDYFSTDYGESCYIRGLAFKTEEDAKRYDRERMLLFKMHKWAEEHNGDLPYNLKDLDGEKYIIRYDYEDNRFEYVYSYCHNDFLKLPYFKSEEIAEQFIKEFGDEIKEVLS